MGLLDVLLGRRLGDAEEDEQHIGVSSAVPVLGLDALSSAAYGPEAALTLLIPLGAAGLHYVVPLSGSIVLILTVVFLSYRQTIAAYPNGGGSYTVAKENLGEPLGLVAGAALALDYILNVAVGISAGVGALVSAVPMLLPHTVALCLVVLAVLTLVNLRGTRESGLVFLLPTYLFVGSLGVVIAIGITRALLHGGHPAPVVAPPLMPSPTQALGAWIILRAFASGCTAMTGVEAVSNAVPIFKRPAVPNAQRALTTIIAILVVLLAGIAYLCRAYGIGATEPGKPGYDSVLSILTAAVLGRGLPYYVTMGGVVAVLMLSANTSFADFPRLCRVLAIDRYLPGAFAVRGRRLVFTQGIILLSVCAAALLVAFGGITDRLIPLFAIGALLAFSLSQAGMVEHWRRVGGSTARRSRVVNGAGALATSVTLVIVAVAKFGEGAWLTVVAIPLLILFFARVNRHYRLIAAAIATFEPLHVPSSEPPIVVMAAGGWNKLMQHGLRFAMRLSSEVHVVQVRTENGNIEDLSDNWQLLIEAPARAAGLTPPQLVVLHSPFRQFLQPFIDFVNRLEREHPSREIIVVIPDLVMSRWYETFLHNNRGTFLRTMLRARCSSRVSVVHTAYRLRDSQHPQVAMPTRPDPCVLQALVETSRG